MSQYGKRCSLKDKSLKTLIGLVFLWSIAQLIKERISTCPEGPYMESLKYQEKSMAHLN